MTRAAALVGGLGLLVAARPAAAEPHRKDRDTARLLSGIGAGVSTGLVLAGFTLADSHHPFNEPLFYTGVGTSLVSPSLGEFYAGTWLTTGMGIRGGAVALALIGAQLKDTTSCLTTADNNSCASLEGKGVLLLGIAAIAYIGGAYYDVAAAPEAVDAYNHNLRLQVLPGPMPTTLGPPGGGVWLRGTW